MTTVLYLVAAVVAVAALYAILTPLIRAFVRYRGARVVTCPENQKPAGVEVNAAHAALSKELRLKECSRWPDKQDCGQECLRQIESAPEDCLVRNMLAGWYAGKKCVSCGKLLDKIDWMEHKPALLSPQNKTVEWRELAPEQVPEALASHSPVCWDCHVAATFRREHPELITERSWTKH
ncbi:MAG: hypothetical protein ABIG68_13030 [Acidobacteriota bacterium]